ncbi:hypothetical protein MJG53_019738 [Ovis ammon polii x Ovis aries]|uniref:Uncharacterized protein n=2 Tax=Ovis TaxID=9935 RepID=A0A835ZFS7_SHEEP|nr:hypothetical protein JEQ12_020028 [Ovis aries]KAI4554439.1 hypothetical protein MJG53_019738 [Ovis ammon polii x Ovis aries]
MPANQRYRQWPPDLAAEGQGSMCEVTKFPNQRSSSDWSKERGHGHWRKKLHITAAQMRVLGKLNNREFLEKFHSTVRKLVNP